MEDARFCCHRARHDAIDVAAATIAVELDTAVKRLGYRAVLAAFPRFSKLVAALQLAQQKIAHSRGDRDNRDKIYATVEGVDFPSMVGLFNEWRASAKAIEALARRDRMETFVSRALGIVAIASILLTILFWLYPHK